MADDLRRKALGCYTTEQRCAWQKARHLVEIHRTGIWREWGFASFGEYTSADFPQAFAPGVRSLIDVIRFVEAQPADIRRRIERLPLHRVTRIGRVVCRDPARAVAILLRTGTTQQALKESVIDTAGYQLLRDAKEAQTRYWHAIIKDMAEQAGLSFTQTRDRTRIRSIAGVPIHFTTYHDWHDGKGNRFLKLRCYRPGYFLIRVNPQTGQWLYIPPLKRIPQSGCVYIPERDCAKLTTMPDAKTLQNALLRARRALKREA